MASWKFTEDYEKKYPALASSILSLLAFSDHTLTGTAFTGTLDVGGSGAALATIGAIVGLSAIPVSGTVTEAGGKLTVQLAASDGAAIAKGLGGSLPLLAQHLTGAGIGVETVVSATAKADDGPETDELDFTAVLTINGTQLTLTTGVPMHGGFFTLDGTFENASIALEEIAFLMGSKPSSEWFPSTQLKAYTAGGPALSLLGLSITLYATLKPFSLSVSSLGAGIGITGIDLMDQRLYLSPIGIWVLVENLDDPTFDWAIEGSIALCNAARPGDYKNPDMVFDLSMDLTNLEIAGHVENPEKVTVNQMIEDLAGAGTTIGLPAALTVTQFDFAAAADPSSGKLSSFSTDVAMSGGFGLLENLDLEEISISVAYSA